jgi:hypothetical protein
MPGAGLNRYRVSPSEQVVMRMTRVLLEPAARQADALRELMKLVN